VRKLNVAIVASLPFSRHHLFVQTNTCPPPPFPSLITLIPSELSTSTPPTTGVPVVVDLIVVGIGELFVDIIEVDSEDNSLIGLPYLDKPLVVKMNEKTCGIIISSCNNI
jgi:hypothetical protein